MSARERPDVALVGLGESSHQALGLIEKIVKEAACPVIVLLHAPDPAYVKEASKRGVFTYITAAHANDWQSTINIVLRRFADYHDLEGGFGRRALTERAKGILMERHSVDEASAFEMLREHSRTANRKLVDVATAVLSTATACSRSNRRRLRRGDSGVSAGSDPLVAAAGPRATSSRTPTRISRSSCVAGSARVVVPVRSGFEAALAHFPRHRRDLGRRRPAHPDDPALRQASPTRSRSARRRPGQR